MRIQVTEERECCHPNDLVAVRGPVPESLKKCHPKFCKYCGAYHAWQTEMGPAGGPERSIEPIIITDWKYKS